MDKTESDNSIFLIAIGKSRVRGGMAYFRRKKNLVTYCTIYMRILVSCILTGKSLLLSYERIRYMHVFIAKE